MYGTEYEQTALPRADRAGTETAPRAPHVAGGVENMARWGDLCLQLLRSTARRRTRGPARIVARSKNALVFLDAREVWAFEAAERLTFVHTCQGRFDVDLSLTAIAAAFGGAFVRAHRNWLVSIDYVRALERTRGETWLLVGTSVPSERIRVPVSRENARAVREILMRGATGIRRQPGAVPPRHGDQGSFMGSKSEARLFQGDHHAT